MNKFVQLIMTILLFIGISQSTYASSKETLKKAEKYVILSGMACSQYAAESVEELKRKTEKKQQQKLKEFYSDFYDAQSETCLRIMAIKLEHAADIIKEKKHNN